VESLSDPPGGFDHFVDVRARCDAHKNSLMRPKLLPDTMLPEVIDELVIDDIRSQEQSQFS